MNCPYCNSNVELKDSAFIYHGKSYGLIYVCSRYPECDAYCGVHRGTNKPLGRLANAELREWKKRTHATIDDLWKSGRYSRHKVYAIMSDMMGTPVTDTHIGMMDVEECEDLIKSMDIFKKQ
jgi:hypothetical protein